MKAGELRSKKNTLLSKAKSRNPSLRATGMSWRDILDKTKKALMKFNNDRERASSAERWPSHWKDLVHDEDGGYACLVAEPLRMED